MSKKDDLPFTLAIDESSLGDQEAFLEAAARLLLSIPDEGDPQTDVPSADRPSDVPQDAGSPPQTAPESPGAGGDPGPVSGPPNRRGPENRKSAPPA